MDVFFIEIFRLLVQLGRNKSRSIVIITGEIYGIYWTPAWLWAQREVLTLNKLSVSSTDNYILSGEPGHKPIVMVNMQSFIS